MKKLYSLALEQKEDSKHGDSFFPIQRYITTLDNNYPVETPDSGTPSDMLKKVLDYIELNYSDVITVSELADICNFSDYHFMRFFKKYMNMTCIEYINNMRLEKAVELFEKGNTSILDVSLSVGFHNLSYFHRAFKKKYHMTPLSFINEIKHQTT